MERIIESANPKGIGQFDETILANRLRQSTQKYFVNKL